MRRLLSSLTIGAARGIERASIIERLRALLRHRLAPVGALDTARCADPSVVESLLRRRDMISPPRS
jgi:hypothetical protein